MIQESKQSKLASLPEDKKKVITSIVDHALQTLKHFEQTYRASIEQARKAAEKRDPINDSW